MPDCQSSFALHYFTIVQPILNKVTPSAIHCIVLNDPAPGMHSIPFALPCIFPSRLLISAQNRASFSPVTDPMVLVQVLRDLGILVLRQGRCRRRGVGPRGSVVAHVVVVRMLLLLLL